MPNQGLARQRKHFTFQSKLGFWKALLLYSCTPPLVVGDLVNKLVCCHFFDIGHIGEKQPKGEEAGVGGRRGGATPPLFRNRRSRKKIERSQLILFFTIFCFWVLSLLLFLLLWLIKFLLLKLLLKLLLLRLLSFKMLLKMLFKMFNNDVKDVSCSC